MSFSKEERCTMPAEALSLSPDICLTFKGRELTGAPAASRATSWRMADAYRPVVSAITLTTLQRMGRNPAKGKWISPFSLGSWHLGSSL